MTRNRKLLWDQMMPLLRLEGRGTRSFLHGQTTVDCLSANPDTFVHGCWLSSTGRVRALLEIRLLDEGAEILILGGDAEKLVKGFDQVIFPADQVQIKPLSTIRRVQYLASPNPQRFNEVSWLYPDQSLPNELKPFESAAPENFERWRIEQGLPISKGELNGENNPYELGLFDLISLNKGCYLGQETLAKLANLGKVKQELRFWECDGKISVGERIVKAFSNLDTKESVGLVTSSVIDSVRDCSYGLAMLKRSVLLEEELFLEKDLRTMRIKMPLGFVALPKGD
ncbi:tRNA-modifying protein YgfZ [Prochlorococcus sp. MIT 1307]|uniref:CAF17-like 4Fe-4S cluster assembly/insertion protein YgfZ n=1 Tax=Prochlorococcus sp. MIT 1307 TaxID=3096219 RepID=UPI002A747E07|nr:tRNA-modifying protein YgfZ [Prochlorococcus sp. MIT 1307]